ncbi:hypothetical protein [Natronorubrum sulfidifaciens]|uniref:Uncharacterized protein n=1 Tax=Natronorubrum sulfidifaciens JCM 14089 TaxID=1230460 RepID=L9W001_9EURY|nr:hypothetical protein [Natronorubrum sulfidifaciens]ELY42621.1 hypothetical protein C495_14947 [Natronorubrum sulfidifaciens JCM 14089]
MTNSTATSSGVGPFETRFQTGAAVLSALSFLAAVAVGWMGYQEATLLGTELNIISGSAGLMLAGFLGTVALVVAFYMEPGFDH